MKAVIFDWGGVLIENPADGLMKFCAKRLGTDYHKLAEIFSENEADFQSDRIREKQLWEEANRKLGTPVPSDSLWKSAVKAVFKDQKEVWDTVRSLREKGYKTAFLSNTEVPAQEYFEESGYSENFDVTIFSCAERITKPDPEIYKLVLEKLDVLAHEAVFIDDKPHFVKGATDIGIKGIVFRNHRQMHKELQSILS
ncbi:HAD family phosphatase [Candidatus Woesearchaeota archaeon]|nr:HAD family phosphatase [Candidatus Woesearchaeota archaeon]